MRFGYQDSPYLGCCGQYGHVHIEPYGCWNDVETHRFAIQRMCDEFPDGWALSLSEPSLRVLLPMTPEGTRTMPWCKSFASFKPGVGLGYTWEPVFLYGGRKIGRDRPTVKDHLVEPITLRTGLTGAKPVRFCKWVIAALGMTPDDEIFDVFPGTGVMGRVLDQQRLSI